jgi:hypothetical protein
MVLVENPNTKWHGVLASVSMTVVSDPAGSDEPVEEEEESGDWRDEIDAKKPRTAKRRSAKKKSSRRP